MFLYTIKYATNSLVPQMDIKKTLLLSVLLGISNLLFSQSYFVAPNDGFEEPLIKKIKEEKILMISPEKADYIIQIYFRKSWSKRSKGILKGKAKGGFRIINYATDDIDYESEVITIEKTIVKGLSESKRFLAQQLADNYLMKALDSLGFSTN